MSVEFRENAKEKLRAGERFDAPVRHMPAYWWIAAAGSLFVLAAFLAWAFLGKVPLTAEGTGIYIQEKNEVLCFVPVGHTADIKEGMQVVFREKNGGEVSGSAYIVIEENLWDTWDGLPAYIKENELLVKYLTGGQAAVIYHCVLEEQPGFRDGEVLQAKIQKESVHPAELWL